MPVPQVEIEQQHARFDEMIVLLGTVSDEEFDAILAEGDEAEPGMELDPALIARIEGKIAPARQ